MTSFRFPEFLLFLLLRQVHSEEAELVFRSEGSVIEMGYCFGVDYIVVYRCAPEGDQLLGNSSVDSTPIIPPADLQGRIRINQHLHLLGLQISNLTHMDSGIYRRECWQNQTLVNHHTQQLSVCDEEIGSEEIIVKHKDGVTELQCNSTFMGLEGTSLRWYYEKFPSYKLTLFLDSSLSLDPFVEVQHDVIEIRERGARLLLNNSMFINNQQFYCLVMRSMNCLSYQNMYPPEQSDSRDIFASQGDRLVLNCPSDGSNQQWETPFGSINGSSMGKNQMYISFGNKSEDYSLVIRAVSDEHRGKYSCISTSSEVEYSLVLCSRKDPKKYIFEGGKVSLKCDVGKDHVERVQWYYQETSGKQELIHDSNDETIPFPEDLRGRLTLSENGSCLTLYNLKMEDRMVYWCVNFGPEFLESYDDYTDDYDNEEDTEEDGFSENQYWFDTHTCIFRQEHSVLIKKPETGDVDVRRFTPTSGDLETSPTGDPSASSNMTVYAVGGGLAVLLLAVVIVAVIAIKMRSKFSAKQRASRSGLNTNKDIKMNVDPGCTDRLTSNEENEA